MLNVEQKAQILLEWNSTDKAYPLEKCLHIGSANWQNVMQLYILMVTKRV